MAYGVNPFDERLRREMGMAAPVGYAQGVGPSSQRAQPTVWTFGEGTPYEGSSFDAGAGAGGVEFKKGAIASAPEKETPENVTADDGMDAEAEEMMKSSEYEPFEDRVAAGRASIGGSEGVMAYGGGREGVMGYGEGQEDQWAKLFQMWGGG